MDRETVHTSALINQYFDLDTEANSKERILEQLTQQVGYLLDHDFQALLNALYRIDVSEEKFKAALLEGNPAGVSQAVAKLIFDRVMEKARFRMKYS